MLVQLLKSLIRPHLEYGNAIRSTLYKKDIAVIENVQRRATKLITWLRETPYGERLKILKLPSLEFRRLRGDLTETYKFIRFTSTTRCHSFKLSKQRFNLDIRKRF